MIDKFFFWLADHLPRTLVLACAIRLMAHATTGSYASESTPTVTCIDALKRWD